jgi:hypothetical protein
MIHAGSDQVRWVILNPRGNRYAGEQGLNLDFTTPPKRPDRKLPPLFQK